MRRRDRAFAQSWAGGEIVVAWEPESLATANRRTVPGRGDGASGNVVAIGGEEPFDVSEAGVGGQYLAGEVGRVAHGTSILEHGWDTLRLQSATQVRLLAAEEATGETRAGVHDQDWVEPTKGPQRFR